MESKLFGIALIVFAAGLEGVGQLALKIAVSLKKGARYLWLFIGFFFLFLEFLAWTIVLHFVDVTMAYPMSSISYVFVCLLSSIFLKEVITKERIYSLIFIFIGTFIIGFN